MSRLREPNRALRLAVCLVAGLAAGCASTGNPEDPLEGFNRGVYAFNRHLDRAVTRPIAKLYRAVTPDPVEAAIGNFFSNIGDVVVAINNFLQLKPRRAVEDGARVAINSSIGFLGLIDVASGLGLEPHDEDFGQTLARWGAGAGPYIVLPVLGPSSARDALGLGVDRVLLDPVAHLDDMGARNALIGGRALDRRAGLLRTERILEKAAIDEYSFVRDAYLQRRRHLIEDGDS